MQSSSSTNRLGNPTTDSSEYAALVEFIATGGRSTALLKPTQDAGAVVRHALSRRARAMSDSLVVISGVRCGAAKGKH